MRGKIIWSIVLMFFVFCFDTTSQAGSIWAKRDKNKKDLYADNTARNIGDVLTILINEESKLDNKATRTLNKETTRNQNFDGDITIGSCLNGIPSVNFGTGTKYSNKLDGKADYKDEREFTDSVSVIVTDIMPNGNLVVYGIHDRNIADDIQTIEVSGVVRVLDISFNNTIRSNQVGNFSIISPE